MDLFIYNYTSYFAIKLNGSKQNIGLISTVRRQSNGQTCCYFNINNKGMKTKLKASFLRNNSHKKQKPGAAKGVGSGSGWVGYIEFKDQNAVINWLKKEGFCINYSASDCSQYWDFVDGLADYLKLVRDLQQSDILVFKKELGKPEKWVEYFNSQKLDGKESENSEGSRNDGVGILDLLGTYSAFETTIRIYPEAIQECADDLGINQNDLTHVVILHELGHAFVHLGSSGNAVHSAYDLVECNRFWVQLEFFGRSAIHEFLAQSFTWIAVNDPIIRKKHPNLSGIFSKLIQSQPEDYKLWGRQNRPNDEQAWQASLDRARVALDEPSHWENCLRQIRDQMPANLDAAIKLFIKPDDSRPALVSRLFSKI